MRNSRSTFRILCAAFFVAGLNGLTVQAADQNFIEISGVYPHLTMRNQEKECGTGAVVPWKGSLWAITYAPHQPGGSTDKLYQITPDLRQIIFEGSVGGTPANRMIHRESDQLLIGPYLIDAERNIRVIPPSRMFGRLTGTARHLTDPRNKVYYATMEEGLYEVDIHTLSVGCLIRDGNGGAPPIGIVSSLPGYHGKGLYAGPGHLIYANNGERHPEVTRDPTLLSGSLAEWHGQGDWRMVRRNQFTEVSGPGGIYGNDHPDRDPVWTLGWDARSVLLGLLEQSRWRFYRLPKGSHSYDGSHGWNTEWPRIREVGETDLLATMHGTFWRFPRDFSSGQSGGIAPRSNYLKVIGDFCRWKDRIVLGCDDSAQAEFYNTRDFKAKHAAPMQSNSNLWFVEPSRLDSLGPAIGRGSVWLRDNLRSGETSDPYLFSGYDYRQLHLSHQSDHEVAITLEVDRLGADQWSPLREIRIPPNGSVSTLFSIQETGAWIRLTSRQSARSVTANFQYRNRDLRTTTPPLSFQGIATLDQTESSYGLMRSLSFDRLGLVASSDPDGQDAGYYELSPTLDLVSIEDPAATARLISNVAQPLRAYRVDSASVVIKENGQRFRLPKNDRYPSVPYESDAWNRFGIARVCREVATERDLLNVHGTFYELPARNAQGLAKIRPVATHNLAIHDYCSHNGLLFLTGLDAETQSQRIIRSADGKAAVWAGVVDDLWQFGKPRGRGGPWKNTAVQAGQPSDPYLMTAYDRKKVELSADRPALIALEVDVDGTGLWILYRDFKVLPDQVLHHTFPEGFSAYWIRAVSRQNAHATVQFQYD